MTLKTRFEGFREIISKRHQTIRSVSALLGSNITSSFLSAIGGLLIARFLGPEETGTFRTFTIPLTYLAMLHFGTFDGLWRQIPYYIGKEMPQKVDRLASTAGAYNLFLSVVVSFSFICFSVFSLSRQDYYGVFGWFSQAFYAWEIFYGGYLASTYRTLHHFVLLAKIQVTQRITGFVMVFLLPFFMFYGLCARHALPSILVVRMLHRNRPLQLKHRFDIPHLKELIKIGFPFSVWGSLYTSVWFATENTLILFLSGTTELGLFSIAYTMRSALNSLPMAMWQVLTPHVVTNLAKDGSVHKANARILWVTVGLTAFMALIAGVASMLLDFLVPLLIPKYTAGIEVMQISLWFPVVQAAFLPMNILFATGRPWLYGRSVIAGVIVFAVSTYFLLPALGGLLAVTTGSLFGRAARTVAAYVDLYIITKREAMGAGSVDK